MASEKENIADGLLPSMESAKSPLPARKSGRSRSKSIGPSANLTVPIKFEEAANRRKSAILPSMRSILSGAEDEDEARKRKEARRKSLANRRVSFAPEATLHTWDVIEYMRDANSTMSSSTSSSNNSLNSSTRRSPSKSPQKEEASPFPDPSITMVSPGHEPPSTPPEQVETGAEVIDSSPANQREAHQKKRRRSSTGISQGADVYSSSPISGSSSPSAPSEEAESSDSDSADGVDETETGMSMDMSEASVTVRSAASEESSDDSAGSSAKLEEALRQAARQAGTQGIDYDEDGEASMEIAGDTVTNSFVPFVRQQYVQGDESGLDQDKENVDPFIPSRKADAVRRLSHITERSEEDGMSMDMTRAVGGILQHSSSADPNPSSEDGTMDFTMVMPGSGIVNAPAAQEQSIRRASLKRRRSSLAQVTSADETGSPAKKLVTGRRQSLRAARRRSSLAQVDDEAGGEETMELTANLGAIQEEVSQQLLQEQKQSQQSSSQQNPAETEIRNQDSMDTSFEEVPMDTTMVVGAGIAAAADAPILTQDDTNEDLSMELTKALGVITPSVSVSVGKSATPDAKFIQEAQAQQWKFPTPEQPALVPAIAITTPQQIAEDAPMTTPEAAPSESPKRRTPRKSLVPATPEAQKDATPASSKSTRKSSARSQKSAPTSVASPMKPVIDSIDKTPETSMTPQPAIIADTPVNAAHLPELDVAIAMAQPSPTPKRAPAPVLPPPVRSPLAPKSNSLENVAAPAPKLSDSIKQLSTPRKQMKNSPLKKVLAASAPKTTTKSPKKSSTPVKARTTRKSLNPKKGVRIAEEDKENADVMEMDDVAQAEEEPRIGLQDFLNLTGIQFMDLRTTKRRHTGYPGAKGAALFPDDEDDEAGGDGMDSLERSVVAATVTKHNLEMFRHSCQEMNSYISTGREDVLIMEEQVLEEMPPLFKDYLDAPPKERQIIDDQLRAMKAHARLQSKESWYQWRAQLVRDVTVGFNQTKENMQSDNRHLQSLEGDAGSVLKTIKSSKARLEQDLDALRRRREERESGEREQLEEARSILTELNSSLADKRAELDELRKQVQEQDDVIETLQERKEEALGAIKEANRVREECRGWSSEEVATLQAQAKQLENKHHWSLRDATSSPSTITLSYRGEVELFFHPLAFADARSPNASPAKSSHANQPISLNYIARDKATGGVTEVTTTQRFFLQLLRAQLLALPQPETSVSSLLKLVSGGWDTCTALGEGVAQLESLGMTDTSILGDEVIGVKTAVMLPDVATKVMVRFAVTVAVEDWELRTQVQSNVKVVYGERYDEAKMSEFLKSLVGEQVLGSGHMGVWADAVGDLRARLIKRGRKG